MDMTFGNNLVDGIAAFFGRRQREVEIKTVVGPMLYSDSQGEYERLIKPLNRQVSAVSALIAATLEEAKRESNTTGDMITVDFTLHGGSLWMDNPNNKNCYTYHRKDSTMLKGIKELLANGKNGLTHKQLLRHFQQLRPAINDYSLLMAAYRRVSFEGKNKVTSQPIVENGQAGKDISFSLSNGQGGDVETHLPQSFACVAPFSMGNDQHVAIECLIDMALIGDEPVFYVVAPMLDTVIETAILEEVAAFKKGVLETLPEVLVLTNF